MKIPRLILDQLIIFKSFVEVVVPLWLQRHASRTPQKTDRTNRFLILACDPGDPSGSMGDTAMLAGLMQSLKNDCSDAVFTIVGTRQQTICIPDIGPVNVVPAWEGWQGSITFDHLLRQHGALFGLGADVMDGKYGASLVCRFASYCNHAIHLGIPATIVGFSFNSIPRRPAVQALSKLHPSVHVNVRDQISLKRFESTVGIPANICSDVAFLMEASSEPNSVAENWVKMVREKGLTPVGFNINSHAFAKIIADIGLDALVEIIAAELNKTIQNSNIAYIFIPHDIKAKSGDIPILNKLESKLKSLNAAPLITIVPSDPAMVKRITSYLDFIVTARMHLAIAGLGMGTPVISIAYQDKFEGLYQHFNLGLDGLLHPDQCVTEMLSQKINNYAVSHSKISNNIKLQIPHVKKLAKKNVYLSTKDKLLKLLVFLDVSSLGWLQTLFTNESCFFTCPLLSA